MSKKTSHSQAEEPIIKGYKGFDKDFKCREHQFQENKTFEVDHDPIICKKGFHFCEYPLDIFSYYPPSNSTFAEVEGIGKSVNHSDDSKISVSKITIGLKLSLQKLIKAAIDFTFSKIKWTKENNTSGDYSGASSSGDYSGASSSGNCSGASSSGDYSGASSSGYKSGASSSGDYSGASSSGNCSGASSSGDYSGASSSGYKSGASSSGDYSGASSSGNCSGASSSGDYSNAEAGKGCIAMAIGYNSHAKGVAGSWIVLSECEIIKGVTYIKDVKSVAVDGIIIKADTFYYLNKGNIIEYIP
jgi:hypothetical protein